MPGVDDYLAQCVSACINEITIPPWPSDWGPDEQDVCAQRVLLHGIALLLTQHPGTRAWPAAVTAAIHDEARLQTFWEASHHKAIARLIEALHEHGIAAALMKGTAVAYSLYPDPAARRRGDTDLLVPDASRARVRAVFRECGFAPVQAQGGLQEGWEFTGRDGFSHEIDLHWEISSSPAISKALAAVASSRDWVPVPRLSPHAFSLSSGHNLIMACLNRAAHGTFGYFVEGAKSRENDRLIWATDIHLLCEAMTAADWEALVAMAERTDTSDIVRSGLEFAQRAVGTAIAAPILASLAQNVRGRSVHRYLATASKSERFKMDWAASASVAGRVNLLQRHAFPDKSQLLERYPDAQNWPLPALYLRRIGASIMRLVGS